MCAKERERYIDTRTQSGWATHKTLFAESLAVSVPVCVCV